MRFLALLLGFTLLSQTKLDLTKQGRGSPISPSGYFNTMTFDDGRVILLPGPYFGSWISSAVTLPPNSQAICGREYDGNSHPAYEFGYIGMFRNDTNYGYVCTAEKRWKRFKLEEY
ncbi:hypothetical protein UFOVP434_71 [uncultured Caudovirales phage]|uniref:Uncharacterized protein n=1 Tax=uncultured Caudovirales phage TaxID=2100421 RepID=A0A6J5M8R6_9CAUD|nr:hypothetical protein UFOVP434_71 [uncultured Caudovirales phage]